MSDPGDECDADEVWALARVEQLLQQLTPDDSQLELFSFAEIQRYNVRRGIKRRRD